MAGGGGNGGFAVSATVTTAEQSANVGVAIGGKGGSTNVAGDVHVGSTGDIATSGLSSDGVLAQSIGGSGGNGGFSGALTLQNGGVRRGAQHGRRRRLGRQRRQCRRRERRQHHDRAAACLDAAANSSGIVAQSIGGGGGNGGFSLLVAGSYNR